MNDILRMCEVTIDDVRTYWNDRPCNVKHSKKEIGTQEYFIFIAGGRPWPLHLGSVP